MRADHIGAYGYAREVTPNIDRFAERSVVFTRAWSTSNWTYPAHASLLTGLQPTTSGAHRDISDPSKRDLALVREDVPTLATLLRQSGYATGAVVAGPWLTAEFGLLRGYEFQDASPLKRKKLVSVHRSAAGITDHALDWIAGVDPERPLHLLVNYFDAHDPYGGPPRLRLASAFAA